MTENLWDDLTWRGLLHNSTNPQQLRAALIGDPITFYCGFDPTAPSLHLGNLVQLLLMRRLQEAGHHPLALVGGATGLIGDPRPTSERQLHDPDTVAAWVNALRAQIGTLLNFDGDNPAQLVNNLDWTQNLSAIDFLREIGKHFRINNLLRKEAVSARLQSDAGISFTEFSYTLLQGMDFLELFRRHNCVLQTGGSDQWGNLTSGIDLIHRTENATVHAIATPLILNSDGTKFGKSEGNAIWLNPEMTSPFAFRQFWLNTADADVIDRLKIFTFLTRAEIEALAVEVQERPFQRAAQKRLASEVTALVHGAEIRNQVEAAADALFGKGDMRSIPVNVLISAAANLPQGASDGTRTLAELLVQTGLTPSLTRAREAVRQGGVSVNNIKQTAADAVVADFLEGTLAILKVGKKHLAAVTRN